MIFNISDSQFKHIMSNQKFHLPIRWDGKDFKNSLNCLYDEYLSELESCYNKNKDNALSLELEKFNTDLKEMTFICNRLLYCIKRYNAGFPADAFDGLNCVMNILMEHPLKVYQKTGWLYPINNDKLYLFRLRNVNDNSIHTRKEIFHVPANARSMVSACRYSIAGYPSLYLTTSIQLGIEEIGTNNNAIVSRFKLERQQSEFNIRVLELGIKPQDFYEDYTNNINGIRFKGRNLTGVDINNSSLQSNYIKWYPLIAACSFIRANKNTPFASEYIIPQLLMQWVRKQVGETELMGIRYFSCASTRASEMGFHYVFPVNNTEYENNYCSVLRKAFKLTEPVYIKDFLSVEDCERDLINSNSFDKI